LKAFEQFLVELEHIELLHLATLHAYDVTIATLQQQVEDGLVDVDVKITKRLANAYRYEVVAENQNDLKKKLKKIYPRYFREILFVRAISTLEVFLVDTIREIYIRRPEMFPQAKKLELTSGHLLAFKTTSDILTYLINKECRELHNIGFEKLPNYYNQHFEIKFGDFREFGKIKEYHDVRHLLVHRLGKTDEQYRHQYNISAERLLVSKHYLISFFDDIRGFVGFIHEEVHELISEKEIRVAADELECVIYLETLSHLGSEAISSSYHFDYDEKIYILKDIFQSCKEEWFGFYILQVQGHKQKINAYIQHLGELEQDGILKIRDIEYIHRQKSRRPTVPNKQLREIADFLPLEPWPINIRELVAREFDITTDQASYALNRIKRSQLPEETIQEIAGYLPGVWTENIHREVAKKFGLTTEQAYDVLGQIKDRINKVTHD